MNKILTPKIELHIIELGKLEGKVMEENDGIKKAKEELDKISKSKKERILAELRDKAIRDEKMIRRSGFNEGVEKGIKKTIKEITSILKSKGIDEDTIREVVTIDKDKKEKMLKDLSDENMVQNNDFNEGAEKEKIEIVKKMIQKGMDDNTILSVVNITVEQITKIRDNL